MEDEDGTCLLDVLCDPQALNDFLHGTNELQSEDLLINSSSGETSLFADAPSPVSLLGDGGDSPDSPPPDCVDLSFLEDALLSSPEGAEDPGVEEGEVVVQGGTPMEAAFEAKKGELVLEEEEDENEESDVVACCDILQQSLQEAEITEQTMALEAGLVQPSDNLSLYLPTPVLSTPSIPFKPVMLTPRDTQAAVDPPQPSLLAVGPGCPSLKPAGPPQLMGILPGNVFPAASPETSFSLSPAQASSMIIHKTVSRLTGRPLITPTTLRTTTTMAAGPGIVLQRAPLHIQPKLPINIQPRLVQISPKLSAQKHAPGLAFVPGTAPPNILLTQPPGQKSVAQPLPQQQHSTHQHLHKPVSLQLVNQGGSFVLQPQGLFQGQNQFLLPGQSRPLLTSTHQHQHGPSLHGLTPSHLVDGSQILTVPQRQLNFSPVFTTPTGQLALRQATVLSGPLQLQSAAPTVFQMPAQLAGAYATTTPAGSGQRATLVHSPALGNHITLINSSGVLPSDLASISIVNGASVVQGLPFAAQQAAVPPPAGVSEGQLSLQQASLVLLPERTIQEERSSSEETFQPLTQSYGHVVQHVSVKPSSAAQQSSSPPLVTVLHPRPPEPPPAPDPALEIPKLLMPPADMAQVVEEMTHALSHNEAFMQHLQQQALSSPIASEMLVGSLPVVPMDSLANPVPDEIETEQQTLQAVSSQDAVTSESVKASPLLSDPEDPPLVRSLTPILDTERQTPISFSPLAELQIPGTKSPDPHIASPQPHIEPQVLYQIPHQLQVPQELFSQNQVQIQSPVPELQTSDPQFQLESSVSGPPSTGSSSVHSSPPQLGVPVPQQPPDPMSDSICLSKGRDDSAVQKHTHNKPPAALAVESKAFTFDVCQYSPPAAGVQVHRETSTKQSVPVEQQREERLTPAMKRQRFQQQICSDHTAVQTPVTGPAFSTLKSAVRRLLPYHTCTGHLPTQEDFNSVDQEFDTVSGFLLKRTKDMVNKYRQLLVREAQQESPSAEMVMLERLFLQAERCALADDKRKVRRDPESFMMSLASSASSQRVVLSSSPPAWTRLSDRPPGLRTYRSASRGALRLTIKHESGSRKVVKNSACKTGFKKDHKEQDAGLKRDHRGQDIGLERDPEGQDTGLKRDHSEQDAGLTRDYRGQDMGQDTGLKRDHGGLKRDHTEQDAGLKRDHRGQDMGQDTGLKRDLSEQDAGLKRDHRGQDTGQDTGLKRDLSEQDAGLTRDYRGQDMGQDTGLKRDHGGLKRDLSEQDAGLKRDYRGQDMGQDTGLKRDLSEQDAGLKRDYRDQDMGQDTGLKRDHSEQDAGLKRDHRDQDMGQDTGLKRDPSEQDAGLTRDYRGQDMGQDTGLKRDHGGLKRDHTGQQLSNGKRQPQALNGALQHPQKGEEMSNGALPCDPIEDAPQTAPIFEIQTPYPPPMPDPQPIIDCLELPPRDVSAPKLKCYRLDTSPHPEQRFSPPPLLQEDNMLSEHLQSAIDSILELQRLQGPSAAPNRATSGPTRDQTVTSILEGHL